MAAPSLDTPHLILRAATVADAEALWPCVSDPALPYHMTWEAHRDLDETRAFLGACEASAARGESATWVAFERSGPFVGLVGLDGIVRQLRAWRRDVGELGYWTAPPQQGRGFMKEAAGAVLAAGLSDLALHKVTVGCIAENLASKRVIESLGFRFVGTQRDHANRHGRWWDHLSYELTQPEWRAAQARREGAAREGA